MPEFLVNIVRTQVAAFTVTADSEDSAWEMAEKKISERGCDEDDYGWETKKGEPFVSGVYPSDGPLT